MKTILITLLTFCISITSFSQDGRLGNNDKIKAFKVAYLTEKLNLSASEAEKFWPIYNTFEDAQHQLRNETHNKRKSIHLETISEDDAQQLLDEMEALSKKRYELLNNFTKDLRAILPAKKIILLKEAEEEFRRKMIKEFRKRRHNKQNDKP